MKKISLLYIFLLVFIFLSCTPKNTSHLGTWETIMPSEGKVIWHFDENLLQINFVEFFGGQTYSCPYQIDYTKKPIQLDIQMPGENIRAIIEFSGRNSFRVIGEDSDQKPRPTKFEEPKEIITFHKIEK